MMRNKVLAVALLVLTGCGTLIPTEHKEQVAVQSAGKLATAQSADIVKQVENANPPMNVNISGKDNKLDLKVEATKAQTHAVIAAEQDAAGTDSATGNRSKTIPFFVKLIGVGVGLLLVVGVIAYIRKQYAAIDVAFSAGDQLLARQIGRWKDKAMTETDPSRLAVYNNEVAHLERERGTFNNSRN